MGSQSGASAREAGLASFAEANLRRNFVALWADFGLYGLGMVFASTSTVLPAFAEHLGASNLLIGAIPAAMTFGFSVPSLFFANYTERLSRKLPFILAYTAWERLPLLALAGAAYFLAVSSPGLVLVATFLALLAISAAGGALTPAWMDLIGKVIPTRLRGRLFAGGSMLSTGLGLGGAALVGYYLEAYAFPLDYTLAFATGFAFTAIGFVAIALTVEPESPPTKPHLAMGAYLRQLPRVLARDRSFTWYLASRAVGAFAGMGSGFYTVFALRTLSVPEWAVAGFTLVLLAGQTVASLAFGYLADRRGHKPVLVAGAAALAIGNGVALLAGRGAEVYWVFVGLAVANAAGAVSSLNFAFEFAPTEDRPTYIGLVSTLSAPFLFVSPLVGGLIADGLGYRAVFGLAGLAAALNVAVLVGRVGDPRSRPRPGPGGAGPGGP